MMWIILACNTDWAADVRQAEAAAKQFVTDHNPKAEVVKITCAEGDSDGNGMTRCIATVATYCYTASYNLECPSAVLMGNHTTICQFYDGSGVVLPACEDNACPDRE